MMIEMFIAGLLLGAGGAAFVFASMYEREIIPILREQHELRRRAYSERSRRLDAEIDLEDAQETIGFQRDVLYSLRVRRELMEVQDAE